jgi:D-inositol-3-phosphate glycosyltransferase
MPSPPRKIEVALLTGGGDKPYALGLASCLISLNIAIDFIGSDEVNGPELHQSPLVRFLNLRGSQRTDASSARKMSRVLTYYGRLLRYAATAKPRVFHVLWNNKFEFFDRTLLLLYYRLLGKRIVFTAHNVNAARRDGNDSLVNRLTLCAQYRLVDHIFVHTEQMKNELRREFAVSETKISVIPFGINSTVPNTALTSDQAKQKLGLRARDKAILFFGNIAPYKGLEYLVEALTLLKREDPGYRLIIAGRPKDCSLYWDELQRRIQSALQSIVIERIAFIPDKETEIYFKAADVLVLPYKHIFQSGVLFLGYNFGLPVIATDVGCLREEVVEGETGFVCRPQDPQALSQALSRYFSSALYNELPSKRRSIRKYAFAKYSWSKVALITESLYSRLSTN